MGASHWHHSWGTQGSSLPWILYPRVIGHIGLMCWRTLFLEETRTELDLCYFAQDAAFTAHAVVILETYRQERGENRVGARPFRELSCNLYATFSRIVTRHILCLLKAMCYLACPQDTHTLSLSLILPEETNKYPILLVNKWKLNSHCVFSMMLGFEDRGVNKWVYL